MLQTPRKRFLPVTKVLKFMRYHLKRNHVIAIGALITFFIIHLFSNYYHHSNSLASRKNDSTKLVFPDNVNQHNKASPSERFNISYDREKNCLAHTPGYPFKPFTKFKDPLIIWEWNYSTKVNDVSPYYSIIVTAFDSFNVLDKVINSVLALTRGKYELIIVFDDVDDTSISKAYHLVRNNWVNSQKTNDCSLESIKSGKHPDKYLRQQTLIRDYCVKHKVDDYKNKNFKSGGCEDSGDPVCRQPSRRKIDIPFLHNCGHLMRVVMVKSEGIWEASSNNLGMCISSLSTKYFVHVQDDMVMTQIGWNIHISLPLMLFNNDIFSVSARCATAIQNGFSNFKQYLSPSLKYKTNDSVYHGEIGKGPSQKYGRCGADIDQPLNINNYDTFYESSNSNRGPFVINADDMRSIGYFYEKYFKLIFDIPELHLRSMNLLNKHTGFMPLQFRADLKWGATRRKRRKKTNQEEKLWKEYELFRNSRRNANNFESFKIVSKNVTIANYIGKRKITMEMIGKIDSKQNSLCK